MGSILWVSVPSPGDGSFCNVLLSLFLIKNSDIKSALIKLFFETPLASVILIFESSRDIFLQYSLKTFIPLESVPFSL